MPSPRAERSRTRQVMFAASFSVVYIVLRSIPTFEMVGISSRFTGGDFVLTSIALVCGLWSGTLAVLIGTILAYAIRPPIFFGLDFIPAVINVIIASLLLSGRYKFAIGVYSATFLAFVLSPYSLLFGYGYVPYTWLHVIALLALLPPIAARIHVWTESQGMRQIWGLGLVSFVGTMGQHLAGGLLYELATGYVGGISPASLMNFWRIIFWVYPIERLIIIVVSTILALAVQRALKKWYFTDLSHGAQ